MGISIHALCEEGDSGCWTEPHPDQNFYPRPLRGGRLHTSKVCTQCNEFLSTPSARRATRVALRTCAVRAHFYPRPLRGGRLAEVNAAANALIFLSTPSARRATTAGAMQMTAVNEFLSTPSARRATIADVFFFDTIVISIHALCEEGDSCKKR